MSTYKDRLQELIMKMNDFEIAEVLDFAEFVKNKKREYFYTTLQNVPIDDEELLETERDAINQADESIERRDVLFYDDHNKSEVPIGLCYIDTDSHYAK